jgi:uncharacterized protein
MTFEAGTDEIFTCTTCGACCRGFGGTILHPGDIGRIAAFLKISEKRLVDEFCEVRDRRVYPSQGPDGFCVFHKDGLCGIHSVKPSMCRRWPFIESVLADVRNWRAMATVCPGMRADVPDDVIRERVTREIEREGHRADAFSG